MLTVVFVQFDRFEILSAFANASFLIFVAIFALVESIHHVWSASHVHP